MHGKSLLLILEEPAFFLKLNRELSKDGFDRKLFVVRSADEASLFVTGSPPYADRLMFPLPDIIIVTLSPDDEAPFSWISAIRENNALDHIFIIGVVPPSARWLISKAYAA